MYEGLTGPKPEGSGGVLERKVAANITEMRADRGDFCFRLDDQCGGYVSAFVRVDFDVREVGVEIERELGDGGRCVRHRVWSFPIGVNRASKIITPTFIQDGQSRNGIDFKKSPCDISAMANDIHVWLSDEDAEALRARAKRETRSTTNMATVLIRRGLAVDDAADEDKPKRGRPRKVA